MKRDDPRLYIHIQHMLGVMAIKQHTATHDMDQLLKTEGPCATVAYHRGKQDALKDFAKWVRDYTDWDRTLITLKKEGYE